MSKKSDIIIKKIDELISRANDFGQWAVDSSYDTPSSARSDGFAWATEAVFLLEVIFGDSKSAYWKQIDERVARIHSNPPKMSLRILEVSAILDSLKRDIHAGLIANMQDLAKAEVFDDFLEHAESYIAAGSKMEAGVIAGVVFEDTIKKICQTKGIKGSKLDTLINALKSENYIGKVKANRCKSAAAIRNAATHADWDAFEISDLTDTISLTRELLDEFLGA